MTKPPVLKQRKEFLQGSASEEKYTFSGFVLQVVVRDEQGLSVGYTASKKTGNSPTRNRIKRRLREMVAQSETVQKLSGLNLIIIGRTVTADMDWQRLCKDFENCLGRVLAKHPSRQAPPEIVQVHEIENLEEEENRASSLPRVF